MTNEETRKTEIEALSALLDVCGADRTRWPARERLRFAGLIVEDDTARRLVSEARALDRLLDAAPRVSEDRQEKLAERIVTTAITQGRGAQRGRSGVGSTVVPLQRVPARKSSVWQAAALLAASLLLGIVMGTSGRLQLSAEQLAGLTSTSGNDAGQVALGLDLSDMSDEDYL
jgi:hypothetical protein